MRCRAGELAVIVHAPVPLRAAIGRIVRLVAPLPIDTGKGGTLPGWTLEAPVPIVMAANALAADGRRFVAGDRVSFAAYPDAWMTPLRGLPEAEPAEVSDHVDAPADELTTADQ